MKKNQVIWVSAVGGCVLACLILAVAAYLFARISSSSGAAQPVVLENISIAVNAPASAKLGERFLLEVRINNTDSKPQELVGVDLYPSYLAGVKVNGTTPAAVNLTEVTQPDRYFRYEFKQAIPANSSLTVQFDVTAVQPGSFSGLAFVCVNSSTQCMVMRVQTTIEK